ncbi:MAG TPA: STAS domain-containing protein [Longimicrobium sp.]
MPHDRRRPVTSETNGKCVVLDAPPQIIIGLLESLRAELLRHVQEGAESILLNCKATTYVDSPGLSMLVRVRAAAMERGAVFALSHPTPALLEQLELTCLTGLLHPDHDGPDCTR